MPISLVRERICIFSTKICQTRIWIEDNHFLFERLKANYSNNIPLFSIDVHCIFATPLHSFVLAFQNAKLNLLFSFIKARATFVGVGTGSYGLSCQLMQHALRGGNSQSPSALPQLFISLMIFLLCKHPNLCPQFDFSWHCRTCTKVIKFCGKMAAEPGGDELLHIGVKHGSCPSSLDMPDSTR